MCFFLMIRHWLDYIIYVYGIWVYLDFSQFFDNLAIVATLRVITIGGNVRAIGILPALVPEPVEAKLFEFVFGDQKRLAPLLLL